jgi:type II secretory pathway component PulF
MGTTRVGFLVHALAWGILLALLTLAVPKAEALFADFALPLPRVTSRVIDASHLARKWPWSVLIPIAADWFALGAYSSREYTRASLNWSICGLTIPLALIVATIVALLLPALSAEFGGLTG